MQRNSDPIFDFSQYFADITKEVISRQMHKCPNVGKEWGWAGNPMPIPIPVLKKDTVHPDFFPFFIHPERK